MVATEEKHLVVMSFSVNNKCVLTILVDMLFSEGVLSTLIHLPLERVANEISD
jgi:hypothetical protein